VPAGRATDPFIHSPSSSWLQSIWEYSPCCGVRTAVLWNGVIASTMFRISATPSRLVSWPTQPTERRFLADRFLADDGCNGLARVWSSQRDHLRSDHDRSCYRVSDTHGARSRDSPTLAKGEGFRSKQTSRELVGVTAHPCGLTSRRAPHTSSPKLRWAGAIARSPSAGF